LQFWLYNMAVVYSDPVKGVMAALEKMNLDKNTDETLSKNVDLWVTFGKMNSHLYRKWLMDLMVADKLDGVEMFMVYFFFGIIKSQPRVLKAMPNLPNELKAMAWFPKVQNFVSVRIVQYVTQAKDRSKFPAVNIPTTNPGLDILVYVLSTNQSDVNLEDLSRRPTFTQLNLNSELQNKAKVGYQYYWDSVITGTKNKESTEKPEYKEEYYNTSANDKYNLIKMKKDGSFIEFPPASVSAGYTEEEIKSYMKVFRD